MIAEHSDRAPRAIQDIMAYPHFSLSKKPRFTPLKFERKDITIRVTNTDYGIATIYDADLLLWLCTEVRRAVEKGHKSPEVQFSPYLMLKSMGRGWGGTQITRLLASMERLATTYVRTSIRTEHLKEQAGFNWLDSWHTIETPEKTLWSATLSHWMYQGVLQDKNILTLNPGYYRLTSGLEKRIYLIARKHAGKQAWGAHLLMETLYDKAGSGDELRYFARDIRNMAKAGLLLDYEIKVSREKSGEQVWLRHMEHSRRVR